MALTQGAQIDALFEELGWFGHYNRLQTTLALSCVVAAGMHMLSIVFIGEPFTLVEESLIDEDTELAGILEFFHFLDEYDKGSSCGLDEEVLALCIQFVIGVEVHGQEATGQSELNGHPQMKRIPRTSEVIALISQSHHIFCGLRENARPNPAKASIRK